MKKQILTSLAAGLALAVLLCCGTGLAKANHHEQLGHKIEAELAQIEAEALLEQFKELTRHSLKLELERATLESKPRRRRAKRNAPSWSSTCGEHG